MWLGETGDELSPVEAVPAYVARRGTTPGAFFRFEDGSPLTKQRFVRLIRDALVVLGPQFQNWGSHSCCRGGARGFSNPGVRKMDERNIPPVY